MKVYLWNVRGLGDRDKRAAVKDVIRSSKADIVLIQKSKLSSMSDLLIKEVCGSASFDWICLDAVGSSGGIILCCNRRALVIKDRWIEDFSVSALVMDLASNCTWIITFVYGPNDKPP